MAILTVGQAAQVVGRMLNLSGADLQKVKQIYAQIDIDALKAQAQDRIKIVDWKPGDRAPTGVLYEDVYPHLKEGGKAYYLYLEGQLLYFQYSHPRTGKRLYTDQDLQDAKKAHISMLVERLVNEAIIENIVEQL